MPRPPQIPPRIYITPALGRTEFLAINLRIADAFVVNDGAMNPRNARPWPHGVGCAGRQHTGGPQGPPGRHSS